MKTTQYVTMANGRQTITTRNRHGLVSETEKYINLENQNTGKQMQADTRASELHKNPKQKPKYTEEEGDRMTFDKTDLTWKLDGINIGWPPWVTTNAEENKTGPSYNLH